MPETFAQLLELPPINTILSVGSAAVTGYFWLVRSNKERPSLEVVQLAGFNWSYRHSGVEGAKRICLAQIDTGGVLIANHSSRQNSVLRFDCFMQINGRTVKGDWGWTGDDKPPWNIPPETALAISPACFFQVPEEYEPEDDFHFVLELITLGGKRFSAELTKEPPRH